jgi:hypothetical protein
MSLEEIGSFETSFYDEEAREEYSKEKNSLEGLSEDENFQASCGMEGFCDSYGNVEVIGNVESPFEATMYEIVEASASDKQEGKLAEVSTYLRPLKSIRGIKEKFAEKLRHQGIQEHQLGDFNLGLMDVLNALDKGN